MTWGSVGHNPNLALIPTLEKEDLVQYIGTDITERKLLIRRDKFDFTVN